jgi:thiamine-phosphate pyrophosphorylase
MAAKSLPTPPAPRLYLATPLLDDPAPLAADLPALLQLQDVAALLLRLKASDPRSLTTRAKAFAPAVQKAGVALLLDGEPELVARSGADGAHLHGIKALQDYIAALQPDRIAGVGGLRTRHDAMLAGEAGADYVLFGEPDGDDGPRPAPETIAERLQWWVELFEPPCVGYALSFEEAEAFAAAGADFVLVGEIIWNDPRGPAAALAEAAAAIARGYQTVLRAHAAASGAAPR